MSEDVFLNMLVMPMGALILTAFCVWLAGRKD